MLDELNKTMNDKILFREAFCKYIPKNKRKDILKKLCDVLNIPDTESDDSIIDSVRQCCIDNNNSSILKLGFKSVLCFLVWEILIRTSFALGVLSVMAAVTGISIGEFCNGTITREKEEKNKNILFLTAIVLSTVGVTLTILGGLRIFTILFKGKTRIEKYKTMKRYLINLTKRRRTSSRRRSKRRGGTGYYLDLVTCPAGGMPSPVKYDSRSPPVLVGGGAREDFVGELTEILEPLKQELEVLKKNLSQQQVDLENYLHQETFSSQKDYNEFDEFDKTKKNKKNNIEKLKREIYIVKYKAANNIFLVLTKENFYINFSKNLLNSPHTEIENYPELTDYKDILFDLYQIYSNELNKREHSHCTIEYNNYGK